VIFRLSYPEGDSDPVIRGAVDRMLAACDILRPPTPIKTLLEYRRLTVAEQDELVPAPIVKVLRRTAARFWEKLQRKVAGFLNIPERHIAVNPHLHRHRRRFLKFHEVGHDVLSWHRDLFVVTSVSDLTPEARQQFEAEANCFAAHAIFQNDHMAGGYRGKPLRLADLAGVAAQYNASLIATARQYVAIQDIPAALVIGNPVGPRDGRGIRFRDAIANNAFMNEFGAAVLDEGFPADHPAAAVLNVKGLSVSEADLVVIDLRQEQRGIVAETLFTGYCTLTLLHPRPIRQKTSAERVIQSIVSFGFRDRKKSRQA
jgi:hypothetical protein